MDSETSMGRVGSGRARSTGSDWVILYSTLCRVSVHILVATHDVNVKISHHQNKPTCSGQDEAPVGE